MTSRTEHALPPAEPPLNTPVSMRGDLHRRAWDGISSRRCRSFRSYWQSLTGTLHLRSEHRRDRRHPDLRFVEVGTAPTLDALVETARAFHEGRAIGTPEQGRHDMTTTIRTCIPALLILGLTACGKVPHHQQVGSLEVSTPWSRAIPRNAPVAAGFVTIRNMGAIDDRLVAVRSDAADRVEIHEIRHENGMTRMRPLREGLPIPAGETVTLQPGGYHLMFITPRDGFVTRRAVAATLVFEEAGNLDVTFDVRPMTAPRASGGETHSH